MNSMEIRVFQIIAAVVAMIFIWGVLVRYRRGKLTVKESILATMAWFIGGVFAIFPDVISRFIARMLGFESNVNAVIFLFLGVLLLMILRLYATIRDQRKALTQLTRKLAIQEFEKEQA